MPRHRIIPQMFDIRPVNKTGDLDWEKINKIEKILRISGFTNAEKERKILLKEYPQKRFNYKIGTLWTTWTWKWFL